MGKCRRYVSEFKNNPSPADKDITGCDEDASSGKSGHVQIVKVKQETEKCQLAITIPDNYF